MRTNYAFIPTTTCTVNTSYWHQVSVSGAGGMFIIQNWLRANKDQLAGGYQNDGNRVWFQNSKDAMFFKLTNKVTDEQRRS